MDFEMVIGELVVYDFDEKLKVFGKEKLGK